MGIKHQLYRALMNLYHEYFHSTQNDLTKQDDYHKTIYQIEKIIMGHKKNKYIDTHESFLMEIEASKYGISKAESFLQQNPEQCKDAYEDDKAFINWEKSKNDYDYNNYDLNFLLNILHTIVIKDPTSISGSSLETIYESDGSFKKIADILRNPVFLTLDKRIQYHLVGNDGFIQSLNFDNTPKDDLDFVTMALQYRLDLAIKKEKKILIANP